MPRNGVGSTSHEPTTPLEPEAVEREPRGARRKRETRTRLLDAALRLMAQKGMEGVAINEITEAADVGFGSFYNHFESKEAIYGALVDSVFEEFGSRLDRLVRDLVDPAEVISVCVRHTLMRAQAEPVWGRFLLREGLSMREIGRGLGQRLLRDIQRGVETLRFKTADPLLSFIAVSGTALFAVATGLELGQTPALRDATLAGQPLTPDSLPERTSAQVLQILGLEQAEASEIAHRALPRRTEL